MAAVISTLLALLLAEGAVRILGVAPAIRTIGLTVRDAHYQWSDNPILGYELRPGVTRSPGTNSSGMVDVERTVAKPPGTRRIILLGDSVVEGFEEVAALSLDQLMSRRLEKLYGDGKTEVLNLAVGGYCTLAEVERLRVKGLQYKPDVVIVVFVQNDFDDFNSEAGVLASRPRPAIVNWAFRHVHLFRVMCVQFDLFDFVSGADPVRRNVTAIGSNNVTKGLSLLKELSIKHGFEPWVAIWPTFADQGITDAQYLEGTNMLVVEALAAVNDIPTCRLSQYFRSHAQSLNRPVNPRREYTLGDAMHPNAEGSRVAALALKSMLDARRPDGTDASAWKAKAQMAERAAEALGKLQSLSYAKSLLHYGDMLAAGNPSAAIRYYEAALHVDPEAAAAHYGLGEVYLKMPELGKALEHFRRALEIQPDNPLILNKVGFALWRMGDRDKALAHFENATTIAPSFGEAHYNAALLLLELRRYPQARDHLRAALAVRPGDPELLKKLAEAESLSAPNRP